MACEHAMTRGVRGPCRFCGAPPAQVLSDANDRARRTIRPPVKLPPAHAIGFRVPRLQLPTGATRNAAPALVREER